MNTFYKISKEDANKIGRFEYAIGEMFDPFCGEQTDDTYLVSISLVEKLKDNENIMKIDWKTISQINDSQINNKTIELK